MKMGILGHGVGETGDHGTNANADFHESDKSVTGRGIKRKERRRLRQRANRRMPGRDVDLNRKAGVFERLHTVEQTCEWTSMWMQETARTLDELDGRSMTQAGLVESLRGQMK